MAEVDDMVDGKQTENAELIKKQMFPECSLNEDECFLNETECSLNEDECSLNQDECSLQMMVDL